MRKPAIGHARYGILFMDHQWCTHQSTHQATRAGDETAMPNTTCGRRRRSTRHACRMARNRRKRRQQPIDHALTAQAEGGDGIEFEAVCRNHARFETVRRTQPVDLPTAVGKFAATANVGNTCPPVPPV